VLEMPILLIMLLLLLLLWLAAAAAAGPVSTAGCAAVELFIQTWKGLGCQGNTSSGYRCTC
jgi:hypothetical protein